MLKTFFGCCPLSHGASLIAILNLIINIIGFYPIIYKRFMHYNFCMKIVDVDNLNTTYFYQRDPMICNGTPIMSEKFMDYIFVLGVSWKVLQIISNVGLKQSTFKRAPHKIYSWLIFYFANLILLSLDLIAHVTLMIKYSITFDQLDHREDLKSSFFQFLNILLISFEIVVIYAFYKLEKNAMLNTFVQLKWKYVHKGGKVISEGVDFVPTSTFMASTSRQTQENSKQPPYITNILQN